MKKILSMLFVSVMAVSLFTACDKKEENIDNNGNKNETTNNSTNNSKEKCTLTECIKQIKPENTVEEINKIIGFEGELIDEKYNKYYWEFTETSGVEVTYYSGKNGNIKLVYDKKELANDKIDFSKYPELKTKINSGITYDEFVNYVGGVEGILVEKTTLSNKYLWSKSDGSYLTGSFNSAGKCTIASGLIK